ncbi:SIR2 family protein [Brevundimonas sp.]|uniref:SIR2 family protein n=1 Tax=Brevundimonas sp. TaxID=1871086 RepID=UPI003D0FEA0E
MTIRFSENGPEIPSALLDALIAGDVVFVCGAGISAPQLPHFRLLVEQVYAGLNAEMEPSEEASFQAGRYEEALGSLSRRMVGSRDVVDTASALLAVPDPVDLTRHATVLRLSRDIANQVIVVTTNFDTLIERALADHTGGDVREESAAGQGLPPPGGADFHGVIHLHGRLRDEALGLEPTPLVLTSADYGDAYMRSGWASRFLFDLIRCKTIVLLGYSASDAPIRYFLSVLAADRARFPALNPVYAFYAVFEDVAEADAHWGTLAVEPIPYRAFRDPETGAEDHAALYDDLARLADVVERPKASRRERARALLQRDPGSLTPLETNEVDWLFNGRSDLWDLVIREVTQAGWFELFRKRKLWDDKTASWVVAAWAALEPQSRGRYETAIRWKGLLGEPFTDEVAWRIRQTADLPDLWRKAWRLLCVDQLQEDNVWDLKSPYEILEAMKQGVVLDRDLEHAVGWLRPRLDIEPHTGAIYGSPPPEPAERLHDIAWPRLKLSDRGALPDLLNAIPQWDSEARLLDLMASALASTVLTAGDAEMIRDEYDAVDGGLPSIEPHKQNDHRDGVVHLAQTSATLLPKLAATDRDAARAIVARWRALPGRLGLRLWLQACRTPALFTPSEVLIDLERLSEIDFWTLRRELALVFREGLAGAPEDEVLRLEARILDTADAYFRRYELDEGQMDWRPHARDAEVWLRLMMLSEAGLLSQPGKDELTAIKVRRDYLDRAVEDRDFFGSYMSEVTVVTGDPSPIVEAADEDRLEVALQVRASRDLHTQHGWSAYARQDPEGAFKTLMDGPRNEPNAPLWQEFIGTLSWPSDQEDTTKSRLTVSVFEVLDGAEDDFIDLVSDRLVDLLWGAADAADIDSGAWWSRLWASVVRSDDGAAPKVDDLYSQAINHPAGRLTQIALKSIERQRRDTPDVREPWLGRLRQAGAEGGLSGIMAWAVMAHDLVFVLSVAEEDAVRVMAPAMSADDDIGAGLRKVAVEEGRVSPLLTRRFGPILIKAATENTSSGWSQVHAAGKLLIPLASVASGDKAADAWGVTTAEVAHALRVGTPSLRDGAAEWFRRALEEEADPAATWRGWMGTLFRTVWPREAKYRDAALNRHLADFAIAASDAFPEALELLRPYFMPRGAGRGHTNSLSKSDLPDRFPNACLDLVWILFGLGEVVDNYELPKLLDRLITAAPRLEADRRLQWLEHRVFRFD